MFNLFTFHIAFTKGIAENVLIIMSILAIICAILVIISKNPVISVLFLIGLFFSIALYLILIGISFIGLSYLLVYVGAVSILFLFILMLINVRISELSTDNNNSIPLSVIIISTFNLVFHDKFFYFNNINDTVINNLTVYSSDNFLGLQKSNPAVGDTISKSEEFIGHKSLTPHTYIDTNYTDNVISKVYNSSSYSWDSTLAETSHITSIGNILYTSYPMLLLVTSLILLLAMIGSIVITIKE